MSDNPYGPNEPPGDPEWPPYKPDRRLITYLERGRSQEELDAILREGEGDPPFRPDRDLIVYGGGGRKSASWVARVKKALRGLRSGPRNPT